MKELYKLPIKTEVYRPVLDEFVKRVENDNLAEGLVLFGSSARGQAKPESDLDILTVVKERWPESRDNFNKAITKVRNSDAYKELREQGLDPQIYPFYIEMEQLNNPPLIACEIVNHGVIIFDPTTLIESSFNNLNSELAVCKREVTPDGRIIWRGLPVAKEGAIGLSVSDRLMLLKVSIAESLEEANFSNNRGIHNLSVRRSQEAVELAMTKLLLEMGVHAPKDHDMAETVFEALHLQGIHVDQSVESQIKEITLSLTRMRGHAMHQTIGYGKSIADDALSQARKVVDFTESLSPFSTVTEQKQSVLTICGSMCKLYEMRETQARLAQVPNWTIIIPEAYTQEQEASIQSGNYKDTAELKQQNNAIKGHHNNIARATWVLIHNNENKGRTGYIGANTFLEVGFAHVLNKPIYTLNRYDQNTFMIDELNAVNPIVLDGSLDNMINRMEAENQTNLKR
jgi:HEPN domain-containing protein